MKPLTISIITATFNSKNHLPKLISSLRSQTDKDFEWVVVDGLSNDGTLDILNSVNDLNLKYISEKDCGIYDALNKAIKISNGEYYLVAGSDDMFFENAIEKYREVLNESMAEIIAAGLMLGEKKFLPQKKLGWLYGMAGIASSHSVGMLIKKELHNKHGYYDKKLPIAADQLFIKTALYKGASIKRTNFLAGKMSMEGFSSQSVLFFHVELFIVQMKTEKFKLLQIFIFVFRLLKNYRKL